MQSSSVYAISSGIQDEWAIGNSGNVLLTSSVASTMKASGASWVRLHFRLFGSHTTWDTTSFNRVDQVVSNLITYGLNIMGLVNGESWSTVSGRQDWVSNNVECQGSAGDNRFNTKLEQNGE